MARESPARYSGWYSLWSLSFWNPSRMASSVMDDIHSRLTGQEAPAFCMTHRWMSSPSCPASPQLMISSAACMSRSMTSNCRRMLSSLMSLMPKRVGIIGSAERLHAFHAGV